MKPSARTSLADATVQEIQLELMRRASFDAFDGERVVASLLAHRHLWEAALMDRLALMRAGKLPASGLVKLRDLPDNLWNVDTLYLLCPDAESAKELAKIAETEDWGGLVLVRTDSEQVDDALGSGRETRAIVSVWWD